MWNKLLVKKLQEEEERNKKHTRAATLYSREENQTVILEVP
jgi:hypothetical protein